MRIVSLVPSLTETLCDLGLEDDIVGVTRWCVRPEHLRAEKTVVGGTKNPDVARILDLAPDLVVMDRDENRREHAEALAARGVRLFVTDVRAVEDVAPAVRRLGEATGRKAEATRLAHQVEDAMRGVKDSVFAEREVSLLVPVWKEPWIAPNRDTYLGSVVAWGGGRNVFAAARERWPKFDPAALPEKPDGVLLPTEPYRFTKNDVEAFVRAGYRPGTVNLVNGQEATWFGSRTVTGLRSVERVIAGIRRAAFG